MSMFKPVIPLTTEVAVRPRFCKAIGCLAVFFGILYTPWLQAEVVDMSPNLGRALSPEEIAETDMTVLPNGEGLPVGQGSVGLGSNVYLRECLACHGEGGVGGVNEALVGGVGSLASNRPKVTVGSYWPYATTLFDYIRRAMPYPDSGRLSNDEVYAVTAYLLHANGIIEADTLLNQDTLPQVIMPNREGFYWAEGR